MSQALSTLDLPEHIAGFILFGSVVVVPVPVLHHFVQWRLAPFGDRWGRLEMRSAMDDEFATRLLEFVEEHSMPRATVIWVPYRGRQVEVLVRDGSRRVLPFSILLGADPPTTELECETHVDGPLSPI